MLSSIKCLWNVERFIFCFAHRLLASFVDDATAIAHLPGLFMIYNCDSSFDKVELYEAKHWHGFCLWLPDISVWRVLCALCVLHSSAMMGWVLYSSVRTVSVWICVFELAFSSIYVRRNEALSAWCTKFMLMPFNLHPLHTAYHKATTTTTTAKGL